MQEQPDGSANISPLFKAHVVPAGSATNGATASAANSTITSESNSTPATITATAALTHSTLTSTNSASKPHARTRYRLSVEDFLQQTTEQERTALSTCLSEAITHFAQRDLSVYLDSLGILIPKIVSQRRARQIDTRVLIQVETYRTLSFEKCDDAAALNRSKFGGIVETRELCEYMWSRLDDSLRQRWDENLFRSLVRGYYQLMRQEIILQGFCGFLPRLGDFFALHNRQGESKSDWFAGADIFLYPRYRETLVVEPSKMMERPILHSAWELLEAAYGPPARTLELDLVRELAELGYDAELLARELAPKDRKVPVAVFARLQSPQALIYCTNGLRSLASRDGVPRPGTELVFQLGLASQSHADQASIPDWPTRPLTMGWILLQSSKSKSVRAGAGIACDAPLIKNGDGELRSIFTSPFAPLSSEQLGVDGPFSYINLVGITADEAEVAVRRSSNYLLKVLEYKELDQCTKPGRSSVVARTFLDVELMESQQKAASACSEINCSQEVSIL